VFHAYETVQGHLSMAGIPEKMSGWKIGNFSESREDFAKQGRPVLAAQPSDRRQIAKPFDVGRDGIPVRLHHFLDDGPGVHRHGGLQFFAGYFSSFKLLKENGWSR
jgi:hypothetical protein